MSCVSADLDMFLILCMCMKFYSSYDVLITSLWLLARFGMINELIETDEESYAQKPGANELLPFVNCDNKAS